MPKLINILTLFFGLVLTLPLMAQDPLLAEEPDPGTEPGLAMASVVTASRLPSECLAAVEIKSIDGELQPLSNQRFQIEAGMHTLNGLVTLDTSKCRVLEGDMSIPAYAGLEMLFEEGKTYFIAYDRSSPEPQDWKLVVWKEEVAAEPPGDGLSARIESRTTETDQ